MITELNFGSYPKEVPHSTRLVSTHLNNNSIAKSYELEATFTGCTDKEDAWKLGLVYFIDGVLYSHEPNSKVDMYLFSLVEREDFFKCPFGRESFQRTLLGVDKHMVHLRSLYMKVVEKRKAKKVGEVKYNPEAKYTVYGYVIALQYWAYEAIVQLGSKYATSLSVKTPKMLIWTSNQVIFARDLAEDLKRKKVSLCY